MAAIWSRFTLEPGGSLPFAKILPPMYGLQGFTGCYLGRISDSPAQYILLSAWEDRRQRDDYIESGHFENLSATLATLNATMGTLDFSYGSDTFGNFLEGYNEIHIVYFPISYSDREKKDLTNIVGMFPILSYAGYDAISPERPFASRERPSCGWFEQKQDYYGRKVAASMFIHHWNNPTSETEFKTIAPGWPDEDEDEIPKSTVKFTRDLRRAGALDWETFHVNFKRLE